MYIILMHVHKTFTVDQELAKKLESEDNKSLLINNLLIEHFKKKAFEGMEETEIKKEIEIMELEERIRKLKNGD